MGDALGIVRIVMAIKMARKGGALSSIFCHAYP